MKKDPDKFDKEMSEWLRVIWINAPDDERASNLLNLVFEVAKFAGLNELAYGANDFQETELNARTFQRYYRD